MPWVEVKRTRRIYRGKKRPCIGKCAEPCCFYRRILRTMVIVYRRLFPVDKNEMVSRAHDNRLVKELRLLRLSFAWKVMHPCRHVGTWVQLATVDF